MVSEGNVLGPLSWQKERPAEFYSCRLLESGRQRGSKSPLTGGGAEAAILPI